MEKQHVNYIDTPNTISWDEYFMLQAVMASYKSKDPSTKVGCVIVDEKNHQISMGYNGFVAGIDESQLPWGKEKDVPLEHQKYAYVVHAEANAIMHASRKLEGATVYITLFPCNECSKLLASSRIKEVVYLSDKHHKQEATKISKRILTLSGIVCRKVELSDEIKKSVAQYIAEL